MLTLEKQVEDLAEQGRVEESQASLLEIDRLKTEKQQLLAGDFRSLSAQGEKRMRVCEVCAAFLVVGDTEKKGSKVILKENSILVMT